MVCLSIYLSLLLSIPATLSWRIELFDLNAMTDRDWEKCIFSKRPPLRSGSA